MPIVRRRHSSVPCVRHRENQSQLSRKEFTMLVRSSFRTMMVGAILTSGGVGIAASAKAAGETPLIPRSVLFGNPEKAGVQLSPDGKYISYRAPVDGAAAGGPPGIPSALVSQPPPVDRHGFLRHPILQHRETGWRVE